jgi:hypothetical protein
MDVDQDQDGDGDWMRIRSDHDDDADPLSSKLCSDDVCLLKPSFRLSSFCSESEESYSSVAVLKLCGCLSRQHTGLPHLRFPAARRSPTHGWWYTERQQQLQ